MKIFLCGGGSGKEIKEATIKFGNLIDKGKPLLYIPLAMKNEKYDSCLEWIKEEMKIDFNLKSAESIPSFIENYVYYFNNERLSYKLNYKTPVQYRTEQGFG